MSGLKSKAQFACAWIYDDRQILAYIWDTKEEGRYIVHHLSQDPTLRLNFALEFTDNDETTGEFRAWDYFEALRTSAKGAREHVEGIFDTLFERAGKEFADAEG